MKNHLTELGERRLQLQLQAASQRQQLGECIREIEARFQFGEGLRSAGGWLRKPMLMAGSVAALALFFGPRRALRLAGKAVFLISTARRLLGMFRLFR